MDEKLVSKIQKLLALGAGDSNEAKSAMEKAGQLMAKNNIGLEDISNGVMKDGGILEKTININNQNILFWEVVLASALCKAFSCSCLRMSERINSKRMFIGTKSDLKLLIWYYKYLRIKVAREAETKYSLIKDQKAFGLGVVASLKDRILDMFQAKTVTMTEETKALMVVKDNSIREYVNERYHPQRRKAQQITNLNHSAVEAGMAVGKTMSINRPITGRKSPTGAKMIG